jgi:hypothetical protein
MILIRAEWLICAARRSGGRRIETRLDGCALATLAPFDVVLVDAVFGRRHGGGPAAKWDLTPERLLESAQIRPMFWCKLHLWLGWRDACATCSVFDIENGDQLMSLLRQMVILK